MKVTFEALRTEEPELAALEREILALNPKRGFSADAEWYGWPWYRPVAGRGGYKARMLQLVGHSRARTIPDPAHKPEPDTNGVLTAKQIRSWPMIENPRFNPELATHEAYDCADDHLFNLLRRVARRAA